MNVLLVDDDAIDREHIRRELAKSDSQMVVYEAQSAEAGIELFEAHSFDIILLDYFMPRRDGMELLIEFRSSAKSSTAAIIIMSHSENEQLAIECIRNGAQDFMIKPEITGTRLHRAIVYAQIRFELERKLLTADEEKKYLQSRDVLTGLANRYSFDQTLSNYLEADVGADWRRGVALIDLDNFRLVNDSFGHTVGDELLKRVAGIIQRCVPANAFLSRLGGDEFAYLFKYQNNIEEVIAIVNSILKALEKPVKLSHEMQLPVSASIGIAIDGMANMHSDELLRHAEIAMYRSKKLGRNRYCFYQEEMQTQAVRRINIEAGLRKAIRENEFFLNYQPVYGDSGRSLWGFEALIRWKYEGEFVSPDEFILVAEETRLIMQIGEWVIHQALSTIAYWNEKLGQQLRIAINLSPVQLENEMLDQFVAEALAQHGVDPTLVEFEITETALLEHSVANVGVIERLSELGCQISLDDFGTGYSSIISLQKMPISVVKIDRSIIPVDANDENNKRLTTALVVMIHYLGLESVAEGVETAEQHAFCESLSVDRIQGYYRSKPLLLNDEVMERLLQCQSTPYVFR